MKKKTVPLVAKLRQMDARFGEERVLIDVTVHLLERADPNLLVCGLEVGPIDGATCDDAGPANVCDQDWCGIGGRA